LEQFLIVPSIKKFIRKKENCSGTKTNYWALCDGLTASRLSEERYWGTRW